MYYWNGWWWWGWLWLIPMLVMLWAFVGFGRRRQGWYGPYRSGRDDWDGYWTPERSGSRPPRHRNVGPRNYHRSDTRIAEDVSDRLMMENEIDPSAMDVRVEHGEVFLTGTVASRFEKRLAEQIADSVAGVTDVRNDLLIGKVDAHA
ncbi:MAG TPA: BON domain-containing protein [Polyangiaceae bacterium]|nr:BON domain-containing protein [Polyangiaceae bacterium]